MLAHLVSRLAAIATDARALITDTATSQSILTNEELIMKMIKQRIAAHQRVETDYRFDRRR